MANFCSANPKSDFIKAVVINTFINAIHGYKIGQSKTYNIIFSSAPSRVGGE